MRDPDTDTLLFFNGHMDALDLYLKLLRQKTIEGVIVCSNTVADSGVAAVDVFRNWMKEHGGERL